MKLRNKRRETVDKPSSKRRERRRKRENLKNISKSKIL